MSPAIALIVSYLFIFAVIGASQVLLKRKIVSASTTRKIVHIGVAHWWLFAMFSIDSLALALVGPVSFIGINYISYKRHIFKAMEHAEPKKNLGTIYYPVALTILVLLTWGGPFPRWYGLAAMLVLGWGDGLASLVGEWSGNRNRAIRFTVPGGRKSVAGTAAMFTATGIVTALAVWLFSGPLSFTVAATPAESGFGVTRQLIAWYSTTAARTWVGMATDSTVLVALSRLDGVVRIIAERAALHGPDIASVLLNPESWKMAPTTIMAVALIVAAIATAVELITPWGVDNITIPLVVIISLSLLLPLPSLWLVRLAWALGLNVLASAVAYTRRSITAAGAVTGAATGFVIYLSGGAFFWSVLMAFFFSSSVLSAVKSGAKERAERMHAKGRQRDSVQVLANGGLAAVMAAAHALTGKPVFMLGFAIALAAANADTWASEIGVLSRRDPVSILSFRTIPRGTSGGVSILGIFASLGGALFIGLWFAVGYTLTYGWNALELSAMVLAITGGGFLGSVIDSVLGATVQAQYWDTLREAITERRHDAHGMANNLVRGFHLVTNDTVNAVSGIVSAALMIALIV